MGLTVAGAARPAALLPLTSLRFFAAASVVIFHMDQLATSPQVGGLYRAVFSEGHAGVNFFFLLSGFVLAYSYRDRFTSLTPGKLWDYSAARFARIYPLHLFAMALSVLFVVFYANWPRPQGSALWKATLSQLTLTQAFFPNSSIHFSYNAVAWSLSAEMFFYVTLPFILWLSNRKTFGSSAFIVSMAAMVWVIQVLVTDRIAHSTRPIAGWACSIFPVARWPEFAIGIAVGLMFSRHGMPSTGSRPSWRWTILEIGSMLLLATFLYMKDLVPSEMRVTTYYTPMFCVLICLFARQGGHLSAILSGRVLVYLGEISYAMYLVHALLILLMSVLFYDMRMYFPLQFGAVALVLCIAFASLCHLAIEVPLRKKCLSWLSRKPSLTLLKQPSSNIASRAA